MLSPFFVMHLNVRLVLPVVRSAHGLLFFHTPVLTLVIIVNSFAFFVTGFQAVPLGLLQRDLDYRRLSVAEATQSVVQAVVGSITRALLGWGYWALVSLAFFLARPPTPF